SRTSNNLARVLMKHYWKHPVQFVQEGRAEAYVEIGDRTFGKTITQPYSYDLGQAWMDYTGLPFAYAVWAANKPIRQEFMERFDAAQAIGLQRPEAVLAELEPHPEFDLREYLTHFIDYRLEEKKREAIDLFLRPITSL